MTFTVGNQRLQPLPYRRDRVAASAFPAVDKRYLVAWPQPQL
jgi:hypothetical protein